ncbi:quinone reductase [Trichoderma velutinum]
MPVPQTFKAAMVPEPRAQNTVVERSLESLGPGEIAIQITATAINPVDWKMRDYNAFLNEYPAILGSDAAGVVAEVGPEVVDFAAGDRVFFQGIIGNYDSSTFQQYCEMPASLVSKTPSNISDDEAAGISLAMVAVVTAFYDKTGHGLKAPWDEGGRNIGNGKAIVIIGGASSVGQYAIQMARISGFEKVVTNASPANHELLKSLGAHVVLDRTQSTPEDFKTALAGLPLELVFDAISAKTTQILGVQIVQAVQAAPTHIVTLEVINPPNVDPDAVALGRSQQPNFDIKQVLGVGSSAGLRYLSEPLVKNLGGEEGYIAQGLVKPNRPHVVAGGLHAVEEALGLNKKGVSGEKVVIRPFDV